MAERFASVEDYLRSLPGGVREVVEQIWQRVKTVVPGAGEKISYQMPTVTSGGKSIVHVAAWKSHVSLYPEPEGDEALRAELAPFSSGRGTLRFPLGQPIPYELIERVVARLYEERCGPAETSP